MVSSRLSCSIALAGVIGTAACGGSNDAGTLGPTTFYTIEGRVTEAAPTDEVAIVGARIEVVNGASLQSVATSGPNGEYRLESVSGPASLEISANGYTTQSLRAAMTSSSVRADARLRPTPSTIRQDLTFGQDVPPSVFRAVHNAGEVTISRVYPRYPLSTFPVPVLTIEVWRGGEQIALGNAFAYENFADYAVPLRVAVDGGAVYEIRFRGTNYSSVYQTTMTVESPN